MGFFYYYMKVVGRSWKDYWLVFPHFLVVERFYLPLKDKQIRFVKKVKKDFNNPFQGHIYNTLFVVLFSFVFFSSFICLNILFSRLRCKLPYFFIFFVYRRYRNLGFLQFTRCYTSSHLEAGLTFNP